MLAALTACVHAQTDPRVLIEVPGDADIGANSVRLTWAFDNPAQTAADGFVQTCESATICNNPVTVSCSSTSVRSSPYTVRYSDAECATPLQPSATYHFRVFGLTGGGHIRTVTTKSVPPTVAVDSPAIAAAPGQTVTLTGSGTGNPAPTFAWTCNVNSPTGVTEITAPTPMPANAATATITAPMLVDGEGMPFISGNAAVTEIVLHCDLTATSGGDMVAARTVVTVRAAAAGDAAVDNAVLPNVLRQQTHGIHNGIYQRIQQRQREDGRWK